MKRKQCAVLKKYLAVVAGDEFGRGKHWGCWPFELQEGQRIDLKREKGVNQVIDKVIDKVIDVLMLDCWSSKEWHWISSVNATI